MNRNATARHNRLALELLESREMLAAIAFEVSAALDLQALTAWVQSQNSVELVLVTCDHHQHSINPGQESVVDPDGTAEETASKIDPDPLVFALAGKASADELTEILNAFGGGKLCAVDSGSNEFPYFQLAGSTTQSEAIDQQASISDVSATTNSEKSEPTALPGILNRQQDSSVPNAAVLVDVRQKNVPSIPVLPRPPKAGLQAISLMEPADELNLPAKLVPATKSDLARPRYFASNQPMEKAKIESQLAVGMLDHYQAFTLIEPFENSHNMMKRPEPQQNEKVLDVPQARNLQADKSGLSEILSTSNPVSPILFVYNPAIFAETVLVFVDSSDQLPNDRRSMADEAGSNLTSMVSVENSNTKPNEDDLLLNSTFSSLVICGMLTEPHILRRPTKTASEAPSLQKD